MMTDIHSHDPQMRSGQIKVLSLQLHPDTDFAAVLNALSMGILISAGIHPWHAAEWDSDAIHLIESELLHPRVTFIGEIGMDNACGVSLKKQLFVFESQLKVAETSHKAVLIHNVGCLTELMVLKKKYKGIQAWILHGFRGNAQLAKQYLAHGFYLSFGRRYQVEALRVCPMDRLFLETDDSDTDLRLLYQKVSDDLGASVAMLESSISQNILALGPK